MIKTRYGSQVTLLTKFNSDGMARAMLTRQGMEVGIHMDGLHADRGESEVAEAIKNLPEYEEVVK